MELIRPFDLMEEAAQLEKLSTEQLAEEVGIFAKPFELLLEPIQQSYGQFAFNNSRKDDPSVFLQKSFVLIEWYVEKKLGTQAILLAREWVVCVFAIAEKKNYLEREQRMAIEK
jgi:hypothetical protein